jgi:type II secretory pathway component GspD/PulD (secretin)
MANVPTTKLPNGKLQMYCRLRHYGGVAVSSTRDGGTARRKITTKRQDLGPLVALLNQQLAGKGTATALPDENAVVITCEPAAKDAALAVLGGLDIAPPQVEITARIFEVGHDFDFQYGSRVLINHISSNDTQALATAFSAKDFVDAVVSPTTGDIPDPGAALRIMRVFNRAGLTVDATFQALADTGLIKIVASPRMTVTAGETAYMLAGQELPIQSAKIANDQLITEKVTYKPVGVQLYITPQVIGPRDVKLHVVTEVSAVAGFSELPSIHGQGSAEPTTLVNPIFDTREAETFVTIGHGATLVIGGLRMIRTVTREQKVPGLGDIEVLEWLFKNHRSQNVINDLYFFVTPRLIASGK